MAENLLSVLLKAVLDENASISEIKRQVDNISKKAGDLELGVKVDQSEIERLRREIISLQKELQNENLTTKERSKLLTELNQKQRTLNAESRAFNQQDKQDKEYQRNQLSSIAKTQKDIVSIKRSQQQLDKMENVEIEKHNDSLREQKSLLSSMRTWHSKQPVGSMTQTGLFGVDDLGELKTAQTAYDQLISRIESGQISIKDARTEFQLLKDGITQLGDTVKRVDEIQLSFDNGHGDSDYQNRITAITNELTKYGLSVDEVNQKTENLRTILNGFKIDGNFLPDEQLVAQANKLEAEFKAVKVSVDSAKLSYDKFLQPVSNEKASSLIVRINSFLTKNTAITSEAKAELQSFVAQLNNGVNLGEWNKFNSRLKEIEVEMRQAGKLGKSLTQTFKDSAKSFIEWSTASGAVMEVVQAVKVAIDNVKELDDQLLELSKVSDLSAGGLVKVTEEAYELGDTVGKTGTQVLEAITTFKRAGFELENSTDLAEIALKMVNVAEGIDDASEAAQYLISIMKGYGDTSTEFATKILDSVNEVSNTQSVDFDNLVDGGQRLSAVANQAGVSFDQMLGVLTGGYEVLGNMEKTASGLITIFTRLQSIQLADEEEVQSVAKLQETFSEATNGKVNIVDQTTGQLRGAYDILNDLNEVWNELDKNTQEGLAFAAGGTRQKSVFLSIMSNWNSVEKSVDSATESFGSAEEENSKYLESLSGKITIFESTVEKLSNTVLNSGLLGFFVDLGTFGVNSIDGLINSFGGLTSMLGAGTGIALNKILGYLQRYTYQKSKWFCEAQLHIS